MIRVIIFAVLIYFLVNAVLAKICTSKKYWKFWKSLVEAGAKETNTSPDEFQKVMLLEILLVGLPGLISTKIKHSREKNKASNEDKIVSKEERHD